MECSRTVGSTQGSMSGSNNTNKWNAQERVLGFLFQILRSNNTNKWNAQERISIWLTVNSWSNNTNKWNAQELSLWWNLCLSDQIIPINGMLKNITIHKAKWICDQIIPINGMLKNDNPVAKCSTPWSNNTNKWNAQERFL